LQNEIRDGNFRKDLYFRLSAFPIVIPPLRNREDFPEIAATLWNEITAKTFAEQFPLRNREIKALSKYKWPGNIRQLKNVLQRYALLMQHNISLEEILAEEFSRKTINDIDDRFAYQTARASAPQWSFIQKALYENDGNKSRAAKSLKISRGCLCYQIKKHKLQQWSSCKNLAECASA
jgi:transcriptional regulator with PAS, ATPase and Fis domain